MHVLQYIVSIAGKGSKAIATLTPTREWVASDQRVITALGAQTVAHLAVRNGRSIQSVFALVEGLEAPVITVPASLLKADNIAFRIEGSGESMAVRKASQKATQAYNRAAGESLRKFNLKGF